MARPIKHTELEQASIAILSGASPVRALGAKDARALDWADRDSDGKVHHGRVRDLIIMHYARNGSHCGTAKLIFPRGVPRDLQRECDIARKESA